jgi:anti-sigma regulatory factor (Ser/Thr protein kinase)
VDVRLRLFPTLEAPSEARRGLAPLAGELEATALSDLRTVVSELVTISVANGATKPIDLSLTVGDSAVEGTVDDEGPGTRAIVRAREHRDDSLVLRIIESLVDDWGTDPRQTRIWFRLALDLSRSPALCG